MVDLTKFNKQQQAAITTKSPYVKVIAGAGSGKTAVLTNRIAYLIAKRNVFEQKILAITFTNKAANEMRERVLKLLNREVFLGLITTFHSFCLRVLREDINVLGYTRAFNIIDAQDQKMVLKKINKKLNYDKDYFQVKSIIAYISNKKNNYYPSDLSETYQKIYDQFFVEYEAYLKQNNSLDFDDLILKCVELFKDNEIILEKWRYRYQYIHVDEFQDTNYQQYELIKLLGLDLNVFVVGDPDQTIYTWRGAKIQYILDFEHDFNGAEMIKLEYNYRSQENILALANSLIINNEQRIDKNLIATIDAGPKVEHYIGERADDEARFVVDKINEIIEEFQDVNYDDFAILYRSNYISRIFEQHLTRADIDYQIIGGTRFFERKEIKDILAYLKVIAYGDDISLLRIINTPKRKMGEKSVDRLSEYALNNNKRIYDVLRDDLDKIKLSSVQKRELTDLVSFVEEKKGQQHIKGIINDLLTRYNLLEDYAINTLEYEKRASNIEELINFVGENPQELELFLQDTIIDSTSEEVGAKVSLMSIHAAKGLEFKYVFAVYLCDGIFPSSFAMEHLDLEEERRLAYVCFTRAKQELFLLSHTRNELFSSMASSMFIKEMEQDLLNKSGRVRQDVFLEPKINEMTTFLKQKADSEETIYQINDIVYHPLYKKGVVIAINDNILTIAFENKIGIKTINADFVKLVAESE